MTLFNKGSDKLNSEFKSILNKYNKSILPTNLLALINSDEGRFLVSLNSNLRRIHLRYI